MCVMGTIATMAHHYEVRSFYGHLMNAVYSPYKNCKLNFIVSKKLNVESVKLTKKWRENYRRSEDIASDTSNQLFSLFFCTVFFFFKAKIDCKPSSYMLRNGMKITKPVKSLARNQGSS